MFANIEHYMIHVKTSVARQGICPWLYHLTLSKGYLQEQLEKKNERERNVLKANLWKLCNYI